MNWIVRLGGALVALLVGLSSAVAAPSQAVTMALPTLGEETFLPWLGSTSRTPYMNMIYEFLTYVDPHTLELKPGLAEHWSFSDDGKTLTFLLRRGVQFQRGMGELTADDVKYSIDRCIDPSSRAGPAGIMRARIAAVEAPEPYKVVIRLKSPDLDFIKSYLSDSGGAILIASKKYVEQKGEEAANAEPVGTGPFELSRYERHSSITLTARPDPAGWRPRSSLKTVTFRAIPEEATRIAALLTGEVDLAPISYDSIESARAKKLKIISIKDAWSPVIRFGGLAKFPNDKTPWAKKEVRQALNYAVDKQALVKEIFHGEATASGMNTPNPVFAKIGPYPYDPAKAKALLAQAGYPNGFEITLQTYALNPGAELPLVGQAVALYWEAIGVKTKIIPTDYVTNRANWIGGKATDIVWTHRGFFSVSPVWGLQVSHTTASTLSSFANADTDRMLADINNTLDQEKRREMIVSMAKYLHEEASDVFLVWANEVYAANPRIQDWPELPGTITNVDLIKLAP
jgi:peptide/nickel transport system substrate-binding protein